ncbi:hypothetical protein LEP1GSC116_3492 [Leptospira interrogans serovar Icterohaemorrhagiae str. Verdun HP]|uniref:Uncharacterized protein n=1 Tax=Leptospira interrogans serovar Icterohaemorrhagiae str. Verdun HP TaxID=1049910 RepID=M6RNL7_LEPIR|nr:hypothetical protein LEP1GSC116_3492 [Leptospira interrogans serovar Icterohaemorrhagiae str. Verdun HP]
MPNLLALESASKLKKIIFESSVKCGSSHRNPLFNAVRCFR